MANRNHPAQRFRWPVWLFALGAVCFIHWIIFAVVHNVVDMRPCTTHLPDPLYRIFPHQPGWDVITTPAYTVVAAALVLTLFWRTFQRGEEVPVLRLALGLSAMSMLRAATLLLIPLCRVTVALGAPGALRPMPLTDPRFYALGMRWFAVNDLFFSGHIAFFLLLFFVTADWQQPGRRPLRAGIAVFTAVTIYGLLATREHYTIDVLMALPCAVFADRVALAALRFAEDRGLALGEAPTADS